MQLANAELRLLPLTPTLLAIHADALCAASHPIFAASAPRPLRATRERITATHAFPTVLTRSVAGGRAAAVVLGGGGAAEGGRARHVVSGRGRGGGGTCEGGRGCAARA
eukprot:1805068-Rhodomonas_salina.1